VVTEQPWPQRRLALERVWPLTTGAGVAVAVVDTGVDGRHPLLAGHVLPGADVVAGGGPADVDCVGHGTFVAGLIAGQRRPGIGFSGVAPGATILPVRQTNGDDGTAATLAAGIRTAVDLGATVVNVSITVAATSPVLEDAVRYARARDVVIVAAAGNDAENGNPMQYPAAYPGVVAVGAVDPADQRTDFSETGTGVSVLAPGVDLVAPGAGGAGMVTGAKGTSFAASFVSGVAALVRAYHPALTAAQVKHRIEVTADHPPARSLPDPKLGFGVVNPYRAVTGVLPEELGPIATPTRAAIAVASRPPAEPDPRTGRSLSLAVGMLVVSLAALAGRAVVGAGRRRRWRPGGIPAEPSPAGGQAEPRPAAVTTST
jgi:type VII secretion-associated serine protease mycosin